MKLIVSVLFLLGLWAVSPFNEVNASGQPNQPPVTNGRECTCGCGIFVGEAYLGSLGISCLDQDPIACQSNITVMQLDPETRCYGVALVCHASPLGLPQPNGLFPGVTTSGEAHCLSSQPIRIQCGLSNGCIKYSKPPNQKQEDLETGSELSSGSPQPQVQVTPIIRPPMVAVE